MSKYADLAMERRNQFTPEGKPAWNCCQAVASVFAKDAGYTDEKIDGLLMVRHPAKKARRNGKHCLKGPAKRTEEDDKQFAESFERLSQEALNEFL